MASEEKYTSSQATSVSVVKAKRSRKSSVFPKLAGQRCVAASMAKIIVRMVNADIREHCMAMLQIDDLNDVEGKIQEILQKIDAEIMEEKLRKEKAKTDRIQKRESQLGEY